MDDDLPEKESPRVWIAAGIFLAAIVLATVMMVYTSIRAEAQEQQPTCVHMDRLVEAMEKVFKQRLIWQGVVDSPIGKTETFKFQSETGAWTDVDVVGKDPMGKAVGCFMRSGTNGVPNELGRGA